MFTRPLNLLELFAIALVLTSIMTGCGGRTDATLKPEALQGKWQTVAGTSPSRVGYVFPQTADGGQYVAWILGSDSKLGRYIVNTSNADGVELVGETFQLGTRLVPVVQTLAGSVDLLRKTLTLDGGALRLESVSLPPGGASNADISGAWIASYGGALITLTLNIDSVGMMTGSADNDCQYTGALKARNDLPVFDAQVTEICSGRSAAFNGIATYRPAANDVGAALSVVGIDDVSADRSALGLFLNRVPD